MHDFVLAYKVGFYPYNEKPPGTLVDFYWNLKPPDSLGVKFRFTDERRTPPMLKYRCCLNKYKKHRRCLS